MSCRRPWLSLVIPSFNQARYLEEALAGLCDAQAEGVELIVVDGGSHDGSREVILRHAHRLAWWVSEPDEGQSDALNKGFAKARGEWLGWLNSDDLLLRGAIPSLCIFVCIHPNAHWVSGGGRVIANDEILCATITAL